jgi:uncharacterized membrane protein required for colicin V production
MALAHLHWLDWMGLTLAAYGIAAGAVRGLTQQFTRLMVWVTALLVAGVASPALGWVASWFMAQDAGQRRLAAWFALATVLISVLLVGGLRRLIFGRLNNAKSFADRLLGMVCGLGVAVLAWLTLLGVSYHGYGAPGLGGTYSLAFAQRTTAAYRRLPDSVQTVLLRSDLAPLAQVSE